MAYLSHFCTRKRRQNIPNPLIIEQTKTSTAPVSKGAWSTYGKMIVAGAAGLFVLGVIVSPVSAEALWFFTKTSAAEPVEAANSDLILLDPATHPDPNPEKGGLAIATTDDVALVPSGGPIGDLSALSIGGPSAEDETTYLVREGDSLSEIADMFGVSNDTIMLANGLKSASAIRPGDTLRVLPVSGVEHTVAKGETLAGIAKKYSVEIEEITTFNALDEDAGLTRGDTLIIPGGEVAAKSAKKKTSVVSAVSAALPAVSGFFSNPVPGARLTQGLHGHNGIDFGASCGTAVYASAAGTITVAEAGGLYNGGYGNYVDVVHDNGTKTRYAHLSSVSVSVGDVVSDGALIGGIGNTGRSTGCHLHFEVRGAANPFAR